MRRGDHTMLLAEYPVSRRILNRPFSFSEKESQSNDALQHFVEFLNAHNSDRSSNATRSNLVCNNVFILQT